MCAVWGLISRRPVETGHRFVMDRTSGFSGLSVELAFRDVCAELKHAFLALFWGCFSALVQVMELTCKGFIGSFCFGKVSLEVSGRVIEIEAFLALLGSFIVVIVQIWRTLASNNFSSPILVLDLLLYLMMAPQLVYRTPLWAGFIMINCHQG